MNQEDNQKSKIYSFIYRDIPYIAYQVYSNKMNPDLLCNKEWIKEVMKNATFSWEGFDIQRAYISSVLMVLYTFPEPKLIPEAKFALLTIDFAKNQKNFIRYYTLEKSLDNAWVLGGIDVPNQIQSNSLKHINYGQVNYEPTWENFANDVLARLGFQSGNKI